MLGVIIADSAMCAFCPWCCTVRGRSLGGKTWNNKVMSNWEALGIDVTSGKMSRQLIKLLVAAMGRGCSWVVPGACCHSLKASSWTSAGLSVHLLGTWLFSGDSTKGTGPGLGAAICHWSTSRLSRHLVGRSRFLRDISWVSTLDRVMGTRW